MKIAGKPLIKIGFSKEGDGIIEYSNNYLYFKYNKPTHKKELIKLLSHALNELDRRNRFSSATKSRIVKLAKELKQRVWYSDLYNKWITQKHNPRSNYSLIYDFSKK